MNIRPSVKHIFVVHPSSLLNMSVQDTTESNSESAGMISYSLRFAGPYTYVVFMLADEGDASDVPCFTSAIPTRCSHCFETSTLPATTIIVRPRIAVISQNNPEVDIDHDQTIAQPSPPLLPTNHEGESGCLFLSLHKLSARFQISRRHQPRSL